MRCVELKVKAQPKQEVNVSLTLPRQAHKQEVEAGLVGKSRDIWAAASLPSKDSYFVCVSVSVNSDQNVKYNSY